MALKLTDISEFGSIDIKTAGQVKLRGDVALDHDGSSLYIKAPSIIYFYPGNVNKGNINTSGNLTIAGAGDFGGHVTLGTPAGASQTGYALKLKKTNSGSVVQVGAEIMAAAYSINTNGGNLIFKTANTSTVTTTALTIDGAQNATFAGTWIYGNRAEFIPETGAYDQIKIASVSTNNTNKGAGIYTLNYSNNNTSIMQYSTNVGGNTVYYGSADGNYRGITGHRFYVNASPTATSGHTQALYIAGDTKATFAGNITSNTSLNVLKSGQSDLTLKESSLYGFTLRYNAGSPYTFDILRHQDDATGVSALAINRISGNVGIGTASPGSILHIAGASPEVRIAATTDGQTARLGLYEDTAGYNHGGYIQYVGGGDTLRLGLVNGNVDLDVLTMTDAGASTFAGTVAASGLTTSGVTNNFTTGNTWGTNLQLTNTNDDASPSILTFLKSPASGHTAMADNDYIGFINFRADNDANQLHSWVELSALAIDVTDGSEDSAFRIGTWGAGTEYANTIIAKSGKVGINVASPAAHLQIGAASGTTLALSNSSSITSGNRGDIAWYNSDVSTVATIRAAAVTDNVGTELQFYTRPAGGSLLERFVLESDGSATFVGNVGVGTTAFDSTLERQLKVGTMGSGIVGPIFDATTNATSSRLIVCANTGSPSVSLRHYSASYGLDIWIGTSSTWDTYFDNRQATSGFRWRNYTSNDGGEDELMHLADGGHLTIAGAVTATGKYTTSVSSGAMLSTGAHVDAFGYNATSGLGHYIKGTGSTYIYGGGKMNDGGTVHTLLHSGNYGGYSTFTGNVIIPNGSVSSPSINFTNDSNTGIYMGASTSLRFAQGGVDALVIDSSQNAIFSGNVTLETSTNGANIYQLIKVSQSGTSTDETTALYLSPGSLSSNTSAAGIIGYRDDTFAAAANRSIGLKLQTTNANAAVTAVTLNKTGDATFIGDVAVLGDLTVTGTTVTVNQTNLDVSDNIIGLNRGASSNANDSGIIIERGSTGDNATILWDESIDHFVFGLTEATPSATGNVALSTFIPIKTGALQVNGNITGITGRNIVFDENNNNYIYALAGSSSHINIMATNSLKFKTAAGQLERMRIDTDGHVHITSGGDAIAPTIKHSGNIGYLAKLRVINRSGQSSNKGGLIELGGITDDGVSRSDVFGAIAGLKYNATSANRQGYLALYSNTGSALTEGMRLNSDQSATFAGNVTASSGTGHFSVVNASAYQLNGTYIVDSSRNLVNIGTGTFAGTISVTATGTSSFSGAVSIADMVTISYSDISSGENRGLRIINSSGTDQQWNITAGVTGSENESFCIRDATANVNALTMTMASGNATFAGTIGSGAITSTGLISGTAFTITGSTGKLAFANDPANYYAYQKDSTDGVVVSGYYGVSLAHRGNVKLGVGSGGISVTGTQSVSGDATFASKVAIAGKIGSDDLNITGKMGSVVGDWKTALNIGTTEEPTYSVASISVKNEGDQMMIGTNIHYDGESSGNTKSNASKGSSALYMYTSGSNSTTTGSTIIGGYYAISGGAHSGLVSHVTVLGSGRVGIGDFASVPTLLSNSTTRIANADGLTTHLSGINWAVNGQGYTAALSNLSTTGSQHNGGLLVELASADSTDKILDLESGGVNRLRVYGNGNINIGTGTVTFNNHGNWIDDRKAQFGTGNDLQIWHDGTNSLIRNTTGHLYIENQTNDGDIIFKSDNGSGGNATYLQLDGGITSIIAYKDILMATDGDGGKIKFGASQDLSIYHDGSNSYIDETGTGHLIIRGSEVSLGNSTKKGVRVVADGMVQLRHNDATKLWTTTGGVDITGYYGFGSTGDNYGFYYGTEPGATQGIAIKASDTGGAYFDGLGYFWNNNTGNGANMFQMQNDGNTYCRYLNFFRGSNSNIIGWIGYNATNTATTFSTSSSDERLKKNIVTWDEAVLPKFLSLQPKKFNFKAEVGDPGLEKIKGYIAQNEVANFPEVYQLNGEGDDARYGFHPMEMVPYLMKAVKELVEKNQDLEARIVELEK